MTNCIEIKGLCKSYPDFSLKNIDLTLPSGSILGLIGENGAGKTTTIKCILNLIRRDAGEITLLGYDNIREERPAKADVGLVLDECFFHDTLRPLDVGRILAPSFQRWDEALFRSYLKKFSLPEKKLIKEFSRGMKMKLSLSADEILDEFLGFIQDEDHAILMSSHITSDLEKVADYIAYIHQGEVVLSDAKDSILDSYGRVGCTAAQLEDIDPRDVLRVRKGSFGCEALVKDRSAFGRKYPMLLVERTTLEDIMLFMGKGEEQ